MKLFLGYFGIVLLGFLVSEASSRVFYSSRAQDKESNSGPFPKVNEVVDPGDIRKYCKFYFARDEEGRETILFACPKRPGFKYEPYDKTNALTPQSNSGFEQMSRPKRPECPFSFGTIPHPTECSQYYLCLFGKPSTKRCKGTKLYDEKKQECAEKSTVDCGKRTGDVKNKEDREDDKKDIPFKCPYPWGTFPDPEDCSKFYLCLNKQPTVKTCPTSDLYNTDKQECQEKEKVDCGSRYNPKETTTTPPKLKSTISQLNKTTATSKEIPTKVTLPSTQTENSRYTDDISRTQSEVTTNDAKTEAVTHSEVSKNTRSEQTASSDDVETKDGRNTQPQGTTDLTTSAREVSRDISADSTTQVLPSQYPDSFSCPRKSGNFAHPEDCSVYFACREGNASIEECSPGTLFHAGFKLCFDEQEVDCESRDLHKESTVGNFSPKIRVTEDLSEETTTFGDNGFLCPKRNGNFVHEEQCSLYYSCRQYVVELVQCLPGLAFSDEHNMCIDELEVDCGLRAVTNKEF